ncbi:monocarboxylate transporter 12-like [Glandiceps talaboti]
MEEIITKCDVASKKKDLNIRGWFVVLGCNIVLLFVLGLNQAIGPFFVVLLQHFDKGAGNTSLVITISVFFATCTGPLASVIAKRFGCRITIMVGGIISSIGHLLSSFATSVAVLCFTHGFLVGFGYGLAYSPSVGMVCVYFKKRHALANGLAYTGSGLGIFVFPPLLHTLIEEYGWRGSFLVLSAINANICVCATLLRKPSNDVNCSPSSDRLSDETERRPSCESNEIDSTKDLDIIESQTHDTDHADSINIDSNESIKQCQGPLGIEEGKKNGIIKRAFMIFDLHLFWESPLFLLMFISCFFLGFGHYIAVIFLLPKAESMEFASSRDNAFLISIMGIFSIIGRGVHGFLLECKYITGPSLYAVTLVTAGVTSLLSPLAHTYAGIAVISAVIGLTSGMYLPLIVVNLTEFLGRARLVSTLALSTFALGVGLIGTPIAGWIYDTTQNYDHVYYLAGVSLAIGGFVIVLVPYLKKVQSLTVSCELVNVVIDHVDATLHRLMLSPMANCKTSLSLVITLHRLV